MARTLVLATQNPHKLEELRQLLSGLPLSEVTSAAELGAPDVIEDGATLEENAMKKAREVGEFSGQLSLADDTGLEVEGLDGAPGVISARWAGDDCSYQDNCDKLLRELEGVAPPDRLAQFRTVVALFDPDTGEMETVEGVLKGWIGLRARGGHGFGYDPLFELDGRYEGRTLAELDADQKNAISHRGRAMRAARELLVRKLG